MSELRTSGASEVGNLFRVLATPVRVVTVCLLADRRHPVRQLVEVTGLSQPLVSQPLRVLRDRDSCDGSAAGGRWPTRSATLTWRTSVRGMPSHM